MKTAAQFFAEYFECEVREAKECHHMTLECMEAFARKACQKQREICAAHYHQHEDYSSAEFIIEKIKNAPKPEVL